MRRIEITVAKLTDWRNRALAGAAKTFKKRERDDRDDEIAQLKSKVGQITTDNELLNAKIAAKGDKRPIRGIRIAFVMFGMLASALLGYSCSLQNPQAQFVSAPSRVVPPPPAADGCGSRGGPGHRLPNGKCASWNSEQNPPAPIALAPSAPTVSTRPTAEPSPITASGCGSRGGPGYRLPSGKCASWSHKRHSPKRSRNN
jgi:hypothetical protein